MVPVLLKGWLMLRPRGFRQCRDYMVYVNELVFFVHKISVKSPNSVPVNHQVGEAKSFFVVKFVYITQNTQFFRQLSVGQAGTKSWEESSAYARLRRENKTRQNTTQMFNLDLWGAINSLTFVSSTNSKTANHTRPEKIGYNSFLPDH